MKIIAGGRGNVSERRPRYRTQNNSDPEGVALCNAVRPFQGRIHFSIANRGWRSCAHAPSLTPGYYLHPLRGFSIQLLTILILLELLPYQKLREVWDDLPSYLAH